MIRATPPFRADHVGSLLRPARLQAARAEWERGALSAEALRAVEDACIVEALARQAAAGLRSATDGEMRRTAWHRDFVAGFAGMAWDPAQSWKADGRRVGLRIDGKVDFPDDHPMLADFRFVKARTGLVPKMTIPSPSVITPVAADWRQMVDTAIYPELEALQHDIAQAWRKAVRAFYDAGCRYLQIDEVRLLLMCDETQRRVLRERGGDPDAAIALYARMIDTAVSGRPADMVAAMHNCRGNFRSHWMGEGSYEAVADLIFNRIGLDAYFMEYDSERAGGFEPLRFLPRDKTVVLGLVTTKTGTLEDKDAIRRRIDAAARFVDLDRLCLSPQCGFASVSEGNDLAEAAQWQKLALVRAIADAVWGET